MVGVHRAGFLTYGQPHQFANGEQNVHRLEPGHHHGDPVVFGEETPAVEPDDGGDMPRPDDPVQADLAGFQDGPHPRRGGLVEGEHAVVGKALGLRRQKGRRHPRGGGLEPNAQKDHLFLRMFLGVLYRVQGGVHDAHLGAGCRRFLERGLSSGDAHHVAKGGQHHFGELGEGDGLVHIPLGGHANRASGAGKQAQVGRHQLPDAELHDGVGVAPAKLHKGQRALPGQGVDLGEELSRSCGIPKSGQQVHGWSFTRFRVPGALMSRAGAPRWRPPGPFAPAGPGCGGLPRGR